MKAYFESQKVYFNIHGFRFTENKKQYYNKKMAFFKNNEIKKNIIYTSIN